MNLSDVLFLYISKEKYVAAIFVIISLCCYLLSHFGSKLRKRHEPPEAKGAWPIIGHLHLFRGPELIHKTLSNMADQYGSLFTVRMGVHQALVVSDWKTAKECLETNDKVFIDRPRSIGLEIMCYNNTMFSFRPYGSYWRELRKISIIELLSIHRVEKMKSVRDSVTKVAIDHIYHKWTNEHDRNSGKVIVEMKKWFGDVNLDLSLRVVVGKTLSEEDKGPITKQDTGFVSHSADDGFEVLREFFELMLVSTISDCIPILRWFDIGGVEKAMRNTAKKIDTMLQKWLEEHKRRNKSLKGMEDEPQDFMSVLLHILEQSTSQPLVQEDADIVIKSTCLAMLLGGSDTATVTLTWTLSLLLNNPHTLKKALDELDAHVGKERQVDESDIKNLVYLQATIKESLRLYPVGPILPTRESVSDCLVGGYHVPKRTRLFVNIWRLQRDPRVWTDPCEFQPERFLTTNKDVDLKGKSFELIPFGSGRRMCPGVNFSLHVMHLTLARLLHSFEITTPSGMSVDMTESPGLTNIKATPLEILVSPRLSDAILHSNFL